MLIVNLLTASPQELRKLETVAQRNQVVCPNLTAGEWQKQDLNPAHSSAVFLFPGVYGKEL